MNDNESKIEINYEELEKQRRESILERGRYAKYELIISQDENEEPFSTVQFRKCTGEVVAKLIMVMESTLESLKKEHPLEYTVGKMLYKLESSTVKRPAPESESEESEQDSEE